MLEKSCTFLFGILFMSLAINCGGTADDESSSDGVISSNSDYAPSSLTGKTLTADQMNSSMVFTTTTHVDMPGLQDAGEHWTGPTYTYKKTSSTEGSLIVKYTVSYSDSKEIDSFAFDTTLVFTGPSAGHMKGEGTETYDYGSGLSEKSSGTIDSDFVLK